MCVCVYVGECRGRGGVSCEMQTRQRRSEGVGAFGALVGRGGSSRAGKASEVKRKKAWYAPAARGSGRR